MFTGVLFAQQIMIMSLNKPQPEAKTNQTQSFNAMATPRPVKPRALLECACRGRFVFHRPPSQHAKLWPPGSRFGQVDRNLLPPVLLNTSTDGIPRTPVLQEGFYM